MQTLIDSALALGRAGQWDLALQLLDTAGPSPDIAVAAAAIAVDRDFWTGEGRAEALLDNLPQAGMPTWCGYRPGTQRS